MAFSEKIPVSIKNNNKIKIISIGKLSALSGVTNLTWSLVLLVGPPRRSKGRDQTKRDPSGPPGWRFGVVITMPHKKNRTNGYSNQKH